MTIPTPLRPSYWFNLTPPPLMWLADRALIALVVALVVVGIGAMVWARRDGVKKLVRQAVEDSALSALGIGLLGLFLYAANDQRAPILSMRFWWLVWGAWLAWAGYRAWKRLAIAVPAEMARIERVEQERKWLPKRKGR